MAIASGIVEFQPPGAAFLGQLGGDEDHQFFLFTRREMQIRPLRLVHFSRKRGDAAAQKPFSRSPEFHQTVRQGTPAHRDAADQQAVLP